MRKTALIFIVAIFVLSGCAAKQQISVDTVPPGAMVTLTKIGVTETSGGVEGIVASGAGEPFEDDPIVLGTTPLSYEFELVEEGEGISGPGFFVSVKKRITEGLIRAELDGGYAERRVTFSGEPLQIIMTIVGQAP